ncbi:SNF2 family N-terminal domain containing protein [Histomonas meleagridis]|uniref:SNF2 family N-terminal domain containing protein n=1 Tax=Histomonas meleagridis TaxID=135588 RepID=UPI003559455C|nr:SNF2 family N-terminal domain containing protein [Histomonas meleagridis]KAH0803902.1 SNF2 family N-terminal domain containing protein [Histomonas meleagridis]
MSWSLVYDRAHRNVRKPKSFNETDEDGMQIEVRKKKRGRPPRVQTPENSRDQHSTNQPRKCGRPPKIPRSLTPSPAISGQSEHEYDPTFELKRKRGRPPAKIKDIHQKIRNPVFDYDFENSDEYYADYAYEYEYEYSDEEEKPEEPIPEQAPNIQQNQINTSEEDSTINISIEPTITAPLEVKEHNPALVVQRIIGQSSIPDIDNKYFVKFEDKSYLSSLWMSKSSILKLENGENALRTFLSLTEKHQLIQSTSIPNLLYIEEENICSNWFEADRVITEFKNDVTTNFLIKWRDLSYDMCTIEQLTVFKNIKLVEDYQRRMKRHNTRKIPSRWKRPLITSYEVITEKTISKSGQILEDFQLEGLNWLIKCYHEQTNCILGDLTRIGKSLQVILMLNYLSKRYEVNGPYLILTTNKRLEYWKQQIEEWTDFNVIIFQGNASSRNTIVEYEMNVYDVNGNLLNDAIRTYELELDSSQACFDKSIVDYHESESIHEMDAEDIELMLRGTSEIIFNDSINESINKYYNSEINEILQNNIKQNIIINEVEINYNQQKEFWNNLLHPPQFPVSITSSTNALSDKVSYARHMVQSIVNHGFQNKENQLDFIKCALTLSPPEDRKSMNLLLEIVGDNTSDDPLKKFGKFSVIIEKNAEKMFSSIIFFAELHRALFLTTQKSINWPNVKPIWGDALSEYALLYELDKNGFKNLQSIFNENELLKKNDSMTRRQVEKKVSLLVQAIERQFNEFPKLDLSFQPLTPNQWMELHTDIIKRTVLNEDEIFKLFHILSNFGVPNEINSNKSLGEFTDVSEESVFECVNSILSVALSILSSPDSMPRYDLFPLVQSLENKVNNNDYLNLIFVVRNMDKIYRFIEDFQPIKESSFEYIKIELLPEWWTPNDSRSLIISIMKHGINDITQWYLDKSITFSVNEQVLTEFLSSSQVKLNITSLIIDQARGYSALKDPTSNSTYVITISSNLKIECYGKVLKDPLFRTSSCIYPIGYISQISPSCFFKNIPQDVIFRCEIEAIGKNPIFVASLLSNRFKEYIGVTPSDAIINILGDEFGDDAKIAFKEAGMSGEFLFGLTNSKVVDRIQYIAKLDVSSTNESQSDDDDDFEPN